MRGASAFLGGAMALVALPAEADEAPGFAPWLGAPSTDGHALVAGEPTAVAAPGVVSLGLATSYAFEPVRLPAPSPAPIEHGLGLTALVGAGIGLRSSVGVAVPMALRLAGPAGQPDEVVAGGQVPGTAFGDLTVNVKTSLVAAEGGGFGLAARGVVTFPTGDPRSFAGEGAVTLAAHLLAEYTFLVAGLRASLGFKGRTEGETWPASDGYARVGNELPMAVALWLRPQALGGLGKRLDGGDRQVWELGVRGSLPAGPVAPFGEGAKALSPFAVSFADRVTLGPAREIFVLAGIEIGLGDALAAAPFRGLVTVGWAPGPRDRDGDGVPDELDQCPELPGVRSSHPEDAGCPALEDPPSP